MKYEIEPADNGFILRTILAPGEYEEGDNGKVDTSVYTTIDEVLQVLAVEIDPGSRYDEKRLYVIRAPGDKNEKFRAYHSKVIWGEIDD